MGFESIAKWVLIVFNCLFFLVGAALLAVGFYILFSPYSFDILSVLDNGIIQAGIYVIIAIGAFVFVIAILGLLGTCFNNKIMIGLYMAILFVIIAAQVGVCAVVISYKSQVNDFVSSKFESTLDSYKLENGTDSYSLGWNSIQIYFTCCGSNNYTDWLTTPWKNNNTIYKYQDNAEYPISCCTVTNTLVVLSGTIDPTAFTNLDTCYGVNGESIPNTYMAGRGEGCYLSFQNYIIANSILVGGVGIGLAAFEVLLFVLALIVCCTLDKKEDVV